MNNLAQVLRQAIEKEEKLMYELELPGPAFQIQQVWSKPFYRWKEGYLLPAKGLANVLTKYFSEVS